MTLSKELDRIYTELADIGCNLTVGKSCQEIIDEIVQTATAQFQSTDARTG